LRIQADQVLPELSASQVLAYRLGENEQTIEDEIELEVREAPLRELLLRIPKGYVIARLTAPGLSDYFVRETEAEPDAEVRLVYGQPVSGRQVIQLRLERNKALAEAETLLPARNEGHRRGLHPKLTELREALDRLGRNHEMSDPTRLRRSTARETQRYGVR